MKVFVTGATGFVGTAIVRELLLTHGHQVLGLARSDSSALELGRAGADALHGDLAAPKTLREGVFCCDATIHAGFVNDFSRFAEACVIDRVAIETLGAATGNTGKPLIVTAGVAFRRCTAERPVGLCRRRHQRVAGGACDRCRPRLPARRRAGTGGRNLSCGGRTGRPLPEDRGGDRGRSRRSLCVVVRPKSARVFRVVLRLCIDRSAHRQQSDASQSRLVRDRPSSPNRYRGGRILSGSHRPRSTLGDIARVAPSFSATVRRIFARKRARLSRLRSAACFS